MRMKTGGRELQGAEEINLWHKVSKGDLSLKCSRCHVQAVHKRAGASFLLSINGKTSIPTERKIGSSSLQPSHVECHLKSKPIFICECTQHRHSSISRIVPWHVNMNIPIYSLPYTAVSQVTLTLPSFVSSSYVQTWKPQTSVKSSSSQWAPSRFFPNIWSIPVPYPFPQRNNHPLKWQNQPFLCSPLALSWAGSQTFHFYWT